MSDATDRFAPEVLITSDGDVRVVTLNRPEAFNAADDRMHRSLAEIWTELGSDPDAGAIVVTGAGKAFSAGGDFDSMQQTQQDPRRQDVVFDEARRMVSSMLALQIPVIAAVNGPAVGLGAAIVSLSDIVLMSERAFIADPHVNVGLVAGDGAAMMWPFVMSLMRAKEYAFTGDRIPATTACELGLANRVVAPDQLMDEATTLARRLAAQPRRALRATKQLMNLHAATSLASALELGVVAERSSVNSPEHIAIVADLRAAALHRSQRED